HPLTSSRSMTPVATAGLTPIATARSFIVTGASACTSSRSACSEVSGMPRASLARRAAATWAAWKRRSESSTRFIETSAARAQPHAADLDELLGVGERRGGAQVGAESVDRGEAAGADAAHGSDELPHPRGGPQVVIHLGPGDPEGRSGLGGVERGHRKSFRTRRAPRRPRPITVDSRRHENSPLEIVNGVEYCRADRDRPP